MAKKVYKCDKRECEKTFSSKFSLKRHILKHLNKKPHKCSHNGCNKAFSLPQYLEEHEYTHTRAKPFVCGVGNCVESFRQRGKLSIHKKQVHSGDQNVGEPNLRIRHIVEDEDEEDKQETNMHQQNVNFIRMQM